MPKVKFSKDDILKAAYEIMKQDGINSLSARKIASKFKGSTAPIYANFKTIDELKKEIICIAEIKLKEYLYEKHVGREIFDAAFGFVKFARDERELFRAIFLDASDGFEPIFKETMEILLNKENLKKSFPNMTFEEGILAIENLWVYLFGYATLIFGNNKIEEKTDEKILLKLEELGNYVRNVNNLQEKIKKGK